MKKMFLFLAVIFLATLLSAQPIVKNLSTGFSVEITQGRHQMILLPTESKAIWFLPPSGEVEIRLRYFVVNNIKLVFTTKINIVSGQVVELPLQPQEETKVSSSNTNGSLQGFAPKIPEVSGSVKAEQFPLIMVDSADVSVLVFDGDFYGAALAPNQKTEPIMTGPGIISMKILYDADPPATSTGKNIWQCPVQGIVTQGQQHFILRKDHLRNVQRDVTKIVFYNPTPYPMVPDGLNIDPISPYRRSRPVKLNQGFNNLSFVYINGQGVKVRAVFELVVSKGTPVVSLNLNPLGNAYGVK